jgi:exodeoxyribonuclease VII large subunit
MPHFLMDTRGFYTLHQLSSALKKRIDEATGGRAFWVKAEVASISAKRHLYLELVQHQDGARIAVMRGIIWQESMRTIRDTLGEELPHILKEGAEILFLAKVNYSPLYGASLHIEQVDLSYSLGELERRKRETIATLRAEGLFDRNRSVPEPVVIQRIALITSAGSAAYTDLMQHLEANEYGYRFHVHLIDSTVQGDGAALQLRKALLKASTLTVDAVVIIRGGGSKLDLEAFNDLDLCRAAARLDLPVITGIGHDVDISVLDMIARSPHKTPTAVADHLINKCLYFETGLSGFMVSIQRSMSERFAARKEQLSAQAEVLRLKPTMRCQYVRASLYELTAALAREVTEVLHTHDRSLQARTSALATLPLQRIRLVEQVRIKDARSRLDEFAMRGLRSLHERMQALQEAIHLMAPERLLARGFSITRKQGRAITDVTGLNIGDEIHTTYSQGSTRAIIQAIEHHERTTDDL